MGYISERLKRRLSRADQKGASLAQFRSLARQVEGDIGSPRSLRRMRDYHPNHAAYLAAQNMVSFLGEELSALPEMREYARVVGQAQEEYLPEGPPMSPLTASYFTTWAFFDAAFGRDRETIGTCLLDLGPDLGLSPDYLEVIRLLQRSYVSVYEHRGTKGERVHLQELISNRSHTCVVPAGYLGRAGELWYARVLPPPFADAGSAPGDMAGDAVVFTTPYLLVAPGREAWIDFLDRTMAKMRVPSSHRAQTPAGPANEHAALEALLKYGLDHSYWNEFVLQAYLNHRYDVILLTGLPDVPESLPHAP